MRRGKRIGAADSGAVRFFPRTGLRKEESPGGQSFLPGHQNNFYISLFNEGSAIPA